MADMTNVSGPWNQPPRSTPIPGNEPINAPQGFDQPAPTSAQFLAGVNAPTAPPPIITGPPNMGMPGQGPIIGPGSPYGPYGQASRRKRSWFGTIFVLLIVVVTLGGIGIGVWAAVKGVQTANDASNRADELTNPALSDSDRTALGLTGGEQFLWEGQGMARAAAVFEEAIGGAPTSFISLQFYGDYAFATVQSTVAPNQVDRYGWRLGVVDAPSPERNDDEAPLKVFTIDQIDWTAVSATVAQAPALLGIPDGTVSHVIVDKPYFIDADPLSVKVYVTSDRDSGYVQVAPDGTVLAMY